MFLDKFLFTYISKSCLHPETRAYCVRIFLILNATTLPGAQSACTVPDFLPPNLSLQHRRREEEEE